MTSRAQKTHWTDKLRRLSRAKRLRNTGTLGLVVLGPLLALATFLVLGPLDQGA